MRLLHARESTFRQFVKQPPKYASLSYRWSAYAPSLKDIQDRSSDS